MALRVLTPVLAAPALARTNYRRRPVATAGGLAVVVAVLGVTAAVAVAEAAGWMEATECGVWLGVLTTLAVGFGLLGLVDDLAGDRPAADSPATWGHCATAGSRPVG